MDKGNQVNIENGMILFHKVECYPIIINKMDGTEGCFVT
jgi:hypothetical protein